MSIHLATERGAARRVVLSCDVPGCPVQVEPPPIERWRSDPDAQSWARDHADGWSFNPARQTDYCPTHAGASTAPADGAIAPRPTSSVRDSAGNPLNRDEYAATLRTQLDRTGTPTASPVLLTAAQATVAARLLDELAGVYRGESLATIAQELSTLIRGQL